MGWIPRYWSIFTMPPPQDCRLPLWDNLTTFPVSGPCITTSTTPRSDLEHDWSAFHRDRSRWFHQEPPSATVTKALLFTNSPILFFPLPPNGPANCPCISATVEFPQGFRPNSLRLSSCAQVRRSMPRSGFGIFSGIWPTRFGPLARQPITFPTRYAEPSRRSKPGWPMRFESLRSPRKHGSPRINSIGYFTGISDTAS